MPLVEIKPAVLKDIPLLIQLEHQIDSTHVWQMESNLEQGHIEAHFRLTRLPKVLRLDYPRNPELLEANWKCYDLFLVARLGDRVAGYLTIDINKERNIGKIIDLIVDEPLRRKGVASALLVAAQTWLARNNICKVILEIQARNHPAIQFARKLQYQYIGYSDKYFNNRDIAFFYSVTLR